MEENKNVKKKLTYEELENVCHQLSEQSRSLYAQLQEANMTNAFRRLDYLFKIVELSATMSCFGEDGFVEKAVKEIVSIMTLPEEEPKEDIAEPAKEEK